LRKRKQGKQTKWRSPQSVSSHC